MIANWVRLFSFVIFMGIAATAGYGKGAKAQTITGLTTQEFPTPLAGQSTQPNLMRAPSFEVASVKLSQPETDGITTISPSGLPRFTATNVTLQVLLEIAFGVNANQIVGAPSWLDTQKYDIEAKVEGNKSLSHKQMQPLLEQLLADRFHLRFHRVMRDFPGFALEIARDRPTLLPADQHPGQAQILPDQLQCPACSMGVLGVLLTQVVGRPVADRTGVNGDYNIKLNYAPDDSTDSPLPSIYSALREQLGLKLTPLRVPVEMLVIDHVDKTPTRN